MEGISITQKLERFLILAGTAKFIFDEILTGEQLQFEVDGSNSMVLKQSPVGHMIVNTGTTKVVSAIRANEIFDPDKPDTFNRCGVPDGKKKLQQLADKA